MKIKPIKILIILSMFLVSCGGSDSSSNDTEDGTAFFRDFNFPEYRFQAQGSTGKDANGDVISEVAYAYTDGGAIAKIVTKAPGATLLELKHDTTKSYSYDDDGNLVSVATFSDEDEKDKTSEIENTYEEGAIAKSVEKTFDTEGEVTRTRTITYDAFGRVIKKTDKSTSGDTENTSEESCEFDGDASRSKSTCTYTYNESKTKIEVVDYEEHLATVRTFNFDDDDDVESTETYRAELSEEYILIDDDDDFSLGGTDLLATSSKTTGKDRVTVEACEFSNKEGRFFVSCTSETKNDEDEKTASSAAEYQLVPKVLNIRGLDHSGYVRFQTSSSSSTFSEGVETQAYGQSYERNDFYYVTIQSTETQTLNDADKLEVTVLDTKETSYDKDGKRIVGYEKERTKGDGEIGGTALLDFTYDDDDDGGL